MTREGILPAAVMERIIRSAGDVRVGDDAKEALREALEERGIEIARKAKVFAEHSKRSTVKSEDIKLAAKH